MDITLNMEVTAEDCDEEKAIPTEVIPTEAIPTKDDPKNIKIYKMDRFILKKTPTQTVVYPASAATVSGKKVIIHKPASKVVEASPRLPGITFTRSYRNDDVKTNQPALQTNRGNEASNTTRQGNLTMTLKRDKIPNSASHRDELPAHTKPNNRAIGIMSCPICATVEFTNQELLANHIMTHFRSHVCRHCGKKCADEERLSEHIQVQHTKKESRSNNCLCYICGKHFGSHDRFQRHMEIHSSEKNYLCPTCGKAFGSSENLKNHMRVHSEERTHLCKYCGKGFKRMMHLKRHEMLHTGEKPYKCQTCGKCYNQSNNLTSHMRVHTGIRFAKRASVPRNKTSTENSLEESTPCSSATQSASTVANCPIQSTSTITAAPPETSTCSVTKSANKNSQDFPVDCHLLETGSLCKHDKFIVTKVQKGKTNVPPEDGLVRESAMDSGKRSTSELGSSPVPPEKDDRMQADLRTEMEDNTVSVATTPVEFQVTGSGLLEHVEGSALQATLESKTPQNEHQHDQVLHPMQADQRSNRGTRDNSVMLMQNETCVPVSNHKYILKRKVSKTVDKEQCEHDGILPNNLPANKQKQPPTETSIYSDIAQNNLAMVVRKEQLSICHVSEDEDGVNVQIRINLSEEQRTNHKIAGPISDGSVQIQLKLPKKPESEVEQPKENQAEAFLMTCDEVDEDGIKSECDEDQAAEQYPKRSERSRPRYKFSRTTPPKEPCPFCGHMLAKSSLLRHVEIQHPSRKLYRCKSCGRKFLSQSEFTQHEASHTTPNICGLCGKECKNDVILKMHITKHAKRPHLCPSCGRTFTRPAALASHIQSHSAAANLTCTTCDRKCKSQKLLKEHKCLVQEKTF